MSAEEVDEAALNKRKKPKPIARKKGKGQENNEANEDGEEPNKDKKAY
jgi:hypothetical protein